MNKKLDIYKVEVLNIYLWQISKPGIICCTEVQRPELLHFSLFIHISHFLNFSIPLYCIVSNYMIHLTLLQTSLCLSYKF